MMVTRAPTEELNMRVGNSHLDLLLRKQDLNPRSMRALLLDLIARFGEHTAPKDLNDLRRQDRVAAVKSDGVSLDALFDPFGTYSSQQNRLNLALKMIAKSELLFE